MTLSKRTELDAGVSVIPTLLTLRASMVAA